MARRVSIGGTEEQVRSALEGMLESLDRGEDAALAVAGNAGPDLQLMFTVESPAEDFPCLVADFEEVR